MDEARVEIIRDVDIVAARQLGRDLASAVGFAGADLTLIATAISEIARNIVVYAGSGEIRMGVAARNDRRGIVIVAEDNGLGLGLGGTRRLMDEFEISSEVGKGTTITMRKWRP